MKTSVANEYGLCQDQHEIIMLQTSSTNRIRNKVKVTCICVRGVWVVLVCWVEGVAKCGENSNHLGFSQKHRFGQLIYCSHKYMMMTTCSIHHAYIRSKAKTTCSPCIQAHMLYTYVLFIYKPLYMCFFFNFPKPHL